MRAPRPAWLDRVVENAAGHDLSPFSEFVPPNETERASAVLMLFGPRAASEGGGEDVVLTARSRDLRAHPGQVSFPGGRIDPGDAGPVDAALREAQEEVGVDPASVEVVGTLPALYMAPTGNAVTPVLAWWPEPGQVRVVDPAEVERVERVPVTELVDPGRRFTVVHPVGYRGAGFEAGGLFVWGFTALLLGTVLDLGGVAREWDASVERPIPEDVMSAWMRDD
ncbi:NUDIX domain-containing protein [Knoellia remsis]|uniref:NUDIX domain-containing protein n=1 Tax=Knoellia remsis TaxID=407159 RepID=A0A2T0UNJ3_9MICO|nr:CoA pyrophosphatase [Knoellia remsis]PRY59466.1 NUDIX domain-containing protein [Knoellia remsis]